MKMKYPFCLFVFSFLSLFTFSQKIETFSGNYTDDNGITGFAKYSYYEKNYERIKQGPFVFSFKVNGVSRELKGQFVEGMRDGLWTSALSGMGASTLLTGTFKKGVPNGKFNFAGTYNGSAYLTMSVEFSEGRVVGDFLYQNTRTQEKVTGRVSPDGYMEGEWKIIEKGVEYIQKYENRFFVLYIERNAATGNLILKTDYQAETHDISQEDILEEDFGWNLYNDNDVYGRYFQKGVWANWDIKSVGGISDTSLQGMLYKQKIAKKKLKELNLTDKEELVKIEFAKKDTLGRIFTAFNKIKIQLEKESEVYAKNIEQIRRSEVTLRDSIFKKVQEVLSFQSKYRQAYDTFKSALNRNDFLIEKIKVSENLFREIKDVKYNEKNFSGLSYPSPNSFYLIDLEAIKTSFSNKKNALLYQSPNEIGSNFIEFGKLIKDYQDSIASIEIKSIESQNNYFSFSNEKFVSEPQKALDELKKETQKITELKAKILLLKNGDKFAEKSGMVFDSYFNSLGSEYTLAQLQGYVAKLKVINEKLDSILKSEDLYKDIMKEVKKEENVSLIEQIILK